MSYMRDAEQFRCNLNDPRHGTINGYKNGLCRCEPCTAANKVYKQRQRGVMHKGVVHYLPIGIACRCGGRLVPIDGRFTDWAHHDTKSEHCPTGELAFPIEKAWRKAAV